MMHAPALKLLVFPSFLLHAARPYRGNGLRISIAFNFGLYRELS